MRSYLAASRSRSSLDLPNLIRTTTSRGALARALSRTVGAPVCVRTQHLNKQTSSDEQLLWRLQALATSR
eukprot:scaffold370748_cov20-Prasinocladus_malaysianus.AAC.1